ncbi:hypothetical protein [Pseudoroseicyclus aestuarii]|uniref:Uncharacterized protein n=1 Tax=Pseudoroseicyclus aestuarii TaxID=1795041 RepID=A0A318T1X3_9RHOB|nr:hypothetical protein [Pseudoroseicyclus aestuarii]PYE85977.1 hypothetical protein DFP88_101651 [Pseudoroseicyclus aestuarii]
MPHSSASTLGRARGVLPRRRVNRLAAVRPRAAQQASTQLRIATILTAFMMFKALAHAWMGRADYARAIHDLAQGTLAERSLALLLHPDPVTVWTSTHFVAFFGG